MVLSVGFGGGNVRTRGLKRECPLKDGKINNKLALKHVRQQSFMEFGHEIISTTILSLPLIQEGQLSVTGERISTTYW